MTKRKAHEKFNDFYSAMGQLVHSMDTNKGALVEGVLLDPAQLARAAADAASDKKASDVLLLDIREVTTVADYVVICSGNNPRQIQTIADTIDEELGKQGAALLHREGTAETG